MNDKKRMNVVVMSIYQELGDAFVEALTPSHIECIKIGGMEVSIELAAGIPNEERDFKDMIGRADAVALVVRFLDVLSLEKIKAIYRGLSADSAVTAGIMLLREPGEMDFKISCPACGQKLWLRDTDVGKRGRCPNCKKPFVIMSQSDHIKSQLMLGEGLPVMTVVRGDFNSFEKSMDALLKSVSGIRPAEADARAKALKNVTTRIEIPDNLSSL